MVVPANKRNRRHITFGMLVMPLSILAMPILSAEQATHLSQLKRIMQFW